MAGSSSTLDFGAGLAQGLAQAFGQHRASEDLRAREAEGRRMQLGRDLLPFVLERISDPNDLDLVLPYIDEALGTTGKKYGKGEIDPRQLIQMALAPSFSGGGGGATASPSGEGAAPAAPAPGVRRAVDGSPLASGAGTSPTATPTATPRQPPVAQVPGAGGSPTATVARAGQPGARRGGIQLLTDAEVLARKLSNEEVVAQATLDRQTKFARQIYDQFKDIDTDFTLYDALAMAGFKTDYNRQYSTGTQQILRGLDAQIQRKETEIGRPLTPAEAQDVKEEWMSATRASTDREAISRAQFGGRSFNMLTSDEQQQVNQQVEVLLGQRAYRTTSARNQANFDAPITPTQAQATNLPVGTTGPQVAGQAILKDAEVAQRRSTESLRNTLVDIRDRLVDPALPGANELGGLAPGAALALRRRSPETRNAVAALEAAVNNVVNVVARTVAEQRGAQTEKDVQRAEAAIVSLQDAVLRGDTRESAKVRINESLKIIDDVLSKLPQQAVPQAPTPRPRADGKRVSGTPPAPSPAPSGGPVSVTINGTTYSAETQAKLDAFLRAAGLKQ